MPSGDRASPHNNYIAAIGIVLVPLTMQYSFIVEQLLVSDLIAGGIAIYVAATRQQLRAPRGSLALLLFLIYSAFITVAGAALGRLDGDWSNILIPLRVIFYYACGLFVGVNMNVQFVTRKVVVYGAAVLCIYAAIQQLAFMGLGVQLPGRMPFLEQRFNVILQDEFDFYLELSGFRASAFFSEPAHLAQFASLALIVAVFGKGAELMPQNIYQRAMIISVLVFVPLFVGSGTAVFGLAFVGATYLGLSIYRLMVRRRLRVTEAFASMSILAVSLAAIMSGILPGVSSGFERVLFSDSETSASFVRVTRAVRLCADILENGGIGELLVGSGFGAYVETLNEYRIYTGYERLSNLYWINTFGLLVASSGFVGLSIFVKFLSSIPARRDLVGALCCLFLVSSLFFSDMAFSAFGFLVSAMVAGHIRHNRSFR